MLDAGVNAFWWYTKENIYPLSSDGDPLISRRRILMHISEGLHSILIFIKYFLSILTISKTYVFFLRTSVEYLKKYRHENGY